MSAGRVLAGAGEVNLPAEEGVVGTPPVPAHGRHGNDLRVVRRKVLLVGDDIVTVPRRRDDDGAARHACVMARRTTDASPVVF